MSFKKSLKLHSVFATCFHSMEYMSPWQRKIQIPVALIKPRLLNPLKTTCVLSDPGLHPAPPHRCVPSVSLCCCKWLCFVYETELLQARRQLHPSELPVILILSNEWLFCLCLYGYLKKRQGTFCFVDMTQIHSFFLSLSLPTSLTLSLSLPQ